MKSIAEAVHILTGGTDPNEVPQRLLDAVAVTVEADLLAYNDVNLATGEARFLLRPGSRYDAGRGSFLNRFGYHPAALSAVGADTPVPRFVSDPRLRALGVGNCCGQAELRLSAGLSLSDGRSRLVGLAIVRAVRDFDDEDRSALAALAPHLKSAFAATLPPHAGGGSLAASLTRREGEVLYWVSMGKTNEEIAIILGSRPMTVKKHLEHIYGKLDVPNRTAAAMLAGKLGATVPRPAR